MLPLPPLSSSPSSSTPLPSPSSGCWVEGNDGVAAADTPPHPFRGAIVHPPLPPRPPRARHLLREFPCGGRERERDRRERERDERERERDETRGPALGALPSERVRTVADFLLRRLSTERGGGIMSGAAPGRFGMLLQRRSVD
uniref:Uncharacterized protein n=1 Tax=Odontella aurita TaxID=265563 RepID=A0A7S4N0F4_9STRA